MDNKSSGRGKKILGKTSSVQKKGEGLQSGKPAGKDVSYSKRPNYQQSGQKPQQSGGFLNLGGSESSGNMNRAVTRGLGGGGLILVIIALIFALKYCGGIGGLLGGGSSSSSSSSSGLGMGLLGNLLGGSSSASSAPTSSSSGLDLISLLGGGSSSSSSSSSGLSSLLGGFSGGSTVSSGWDRTANTGKLDTSVVSGARAKRTKIKGNGKDTWTIMVYMCGTDLESKSGMATNDLNEMAKATIGSNVNIIIYTGGCKQWKTNGISNQVNQIYKVESGRMVCLVDNDGKDSLVKPATLTRFIQYCTKNYPANRQALIFWDHGGGSVSGYGYDEKNSSLGSMGLSGIDSALKNAKTTFDFIGFDACLMATLETGLMLDDYADYMIASEETEPGIGWYYTNWVTKLSNNTSMPTIEIGKNIVDDFVDECNRRCAGQKTTLSVVDLAELSATAPKGLKSFATSTSKLLSGSDYKQVSDARSSTREFASSSKIDQVDLVHLCDNLGTTESKAFAEALLGAVKYNKTSSSMTNAYGLSIYFPYQRTSYVKSAVSTYSAIGLGDEYSRCIQQFATLETGGQQGSSSGGFDVGGLLSGMGGSSGGADFSSLLGSLLGGRSLDIDVDAAAQAMEENQFDASKLVWTEKDGTKVMKLDKEQWEQVHDLKLNVFFDDGEGYINFGLDTHYQFTEDGALLGEYDCTWVAIGTKTSTDGDDLDTLQVVMFNYRDSQLDGNLLTTMGTVPVLLNGERADLIVSFVDDISAGETLSAEVLGVSYDYGQPTDDGSTPNPSAKYADLQDGDEIQFVFDYYTYDGEFKDTYTVGDPITYKLFNADKQYESVTLLEGETKLERADFVPVGNLELGYTDMSALWENFVATYMFTDIYNNEYWTTPMRNVQYAD